ncbi:MAG: pyridoxamine 5'-phosphate oxidase [Candidatus Omnitrophica bacterium]|nr:pyridoxamine 5'-phosphate oxidase [Candidatus Omnitrophota bacterium]
MELYQEAIIRFQKLLKQAQGKGLNEPTAVVLSTADAQGRPSSRTVLLKQADERGFVFYTNLQSRKGKQLTENPRASLCFFWDPLMEQVTVEGSVEQVSDEEADAYWKTRPRESQIGAWASLQSQPLQTRAALLKRAAEYGLKFGLGAIPRPLHWSGFRVIPTRIEFWKSQPFRLNERVLYEKAGAQWKKTLLYP